MKRVVWAAALMVGLLAIYYGLQRRETAKKASETQAKQLVVMDLTNANQIALVRAGKPTPYIELAKRANEWWLVRPIEYRADQVSANALIQQFGEKTYERSFASDSLAKFDLQPAQITVTFTTPAGSETILVGKKTPVDNNVYARKLDSNDVLVVSAGFTYAAEKSLDDFRSKDVFWNLPATLTTVAFETEQDRWQIEERAGQWYAGDLTLSTDKVDALLSRIKNMRIRAHLDPATATGKDFIVKRKLQVKAAGNVVEVLEFASQIESDKTYRARVVSRNDWLTISDYVYDNLWKRPSELMPDPPSPISPAEVTEQPMSVAPSAKE